MAKTPKHDNSDFTKPPKAPVVLPGEYWDIARRPFDPDKQSGDPDLYDYLMNRD